MNKSRLLITMSLVTLFGVIFYYIDFKNKAISESRSNLDSDTYTQNNKKQTFKREISKKSSKNAYSKTLNLNNLSPLYQKVCDHYASDTSYLDVLKVMKANFKSFKGFPGYTEGVVDTDQSKFFKALTLGGIFHDNYDGLNYEESAKLLLELSNKSPDNMAYAVYLFDVESSLGFKNISREKLYERIQKAKVFDAHLTKVGRELYKNAKDIESKVNAQFVMASIPFPRLIQSIEKIQRDSFLDVDKKTELFIHVGNILIQESVTTKIPSFTWGYDNLEYSVGRKLLRDFDGKELIEFDELDLQKENYHEAQEYYKEIENIYELCKKS